MWRSKIADLIGPLARPKREGRQWLPFLYPSGSARYIYPFLLAVAVREDVKATNSDSPSMSVMACEVAMPGIVAVRIGYFRIHHCAPGCPKIY
jgi:hypothetical protein